MWAEWAEWAEWAGGGEERWERSGLIDGGRTGNTARFLHSAPTEQRGGSDGDDKKVCVTQYEFSGR
jgi:hypothetical protein